MAAIWIILGMNITHLIDYEVSITIKFGQTCCVDFYVAPNNFDFDGEHNLEMDDQWTTVTLGHLTEKQTYNKSLILSKTMLRKLFRIFVIVHFHTISTYRIDKQRPMLTIFVCKCLSIAMSRIRILYISNIFMKISGSKYHFKASKV